MSYQARHPRGLVRYLYDDSLDSHILLCDTSVTISEDGRTRVSVLSAADAASLCATMVNKLFEAKQKGIDNIDVINLTLYQSRDEWFRHHISGSFSSSKRFPPEINIDAFPDQWRGSRLSLETGTGGHFFRLLVHPDETCTTVTAHDIDTRHKCSFQVRCAAMPMVCTNQSHSMYWLSLLGNPTIHLCHPWGGLGSMRMLPTDECARWAELTSQALEAVSFRRDTLTALRYGRVWPDLQRTLEEEGARSLKKMGYTCHEIRHFQLDYHHPHASTDHKVIVRLPAP